jgi:hypothetical protein
VGGDCSVFPLCDDTVATCGPDGICVAAGALGDTCTDTNPQPCLVGLTCGADSGTCDEFAVFENTRALTIDDAET